MSTSTKERFTVSELLKLQYPRRLGYYISDTTGTLYASKPRFKVGEHIILNCDIWRINKMTRCNRLYSFGINFDYTLSTDEWRAVWDDIHSRKRKGKGKQ